MNVKVAGDLDQLSHFAEQKIRCKEAKLLFLSSLEIFPEQCDFKGWHYLLIMRHFCCLNSSSLTEDVRLDYT